MNGKTILNSFLAAILILNIFFFHSPLLGVVFGLGFVILSSWWLGKIFFENNLLLGFLFFLTAVIIPLTIVYYFYQLNNWIIAGWLVLFSVILFLSSRAEARRAERVGPESRNPLNTNNGKSISETGIKKIVGVLFYLIFLAISYFILRHGITTEPVRTPWYFVPKLFFIFYFFATACLIYCCTKLKPVWSLILSSIHLLFTFSVANTIFPLGFGYDPFIHQATEKYILEYGFIFPKKLYYLGQYVFVGFLSKLFQISSMVIDKNLVPALAALLLPSTIYLWAKKILNIKYQIFEEEMHNKNHLFLYSFIPLFLFLFIPFSIFTFTTPQNLGYLFVLVLIFLFFNNYKLRITAYGLFSLMILMIHPLAGIAVFIFLFVLIISRLNLKKWLKFLFYIILSFSCIPIFLFFKLLTGFEVHLVNNFNLAAFYHNLFRWSPDLFWSPNLMHLLKSAAYFLWQPVAVFAIIFILALFAIYKFKNNPLISLFLNFLISFIILFINSIILYFFINFPFLIASERGDFAYRLFVLATFFLIPLAIFFISLFLYSFIPQKRKLLFIILIMLIAGGVTSSLYFSYPRQDVYYYERGFNTSQYDFDAIRYLEENTREPYVVLANQQVGAGALITYGFRYFDHQYFFYSIPTGGELYQIYWRIVYENAGREEIKKASELTGAKIVYVYFPDYWFNLGSLRKNLTPQADQIWELEKGVIFRFKY